MDSLTQALLGAATFGIVKHKDIGKKSLLIGAIAGTIPDLDVFFAPFYSEISFLSVHRGISHSIILAVSLSLLLGIIFHKIYKKSQTMSSWILAFFLAIMTHSLLDWCTTYGTKLLNPFSDHLFSTNNIHVFEPIYTLILLIGMLMVLVKKTNIDKAQKTIRISLLLSTLYLSWTFVSKSVASHQFIAALKRQNIAYEKIMVSPTPLNTVLWYGMAKTKEGYYIATYSLLDTRKDIVFYYEESANEILDNIAQNQAIHSYLQYTQDFPLIKKDDMGNVKIYSIKYGAVTYLGKPEFAYPLCFNEHELRDDKMYIEHTKKQMGPAKSYKKLFKRIKGI